MIVSAQFDACPATERRRRFSQIDRNVKDPSRGDADKFSLGLRDLVVKAAQHPAPRARLIVLHERDVEAYRIAKSSCVPAFQEEAPRVSEYLRLEDQYLGN